MKLVLLRHATRSPYEAGDASLNAIGKAQAEELVAHIAPQGRLPQPTHLFSSPKRRAQETLRPLATAFHLPVTIDPNLDERHNNETLAEFNARIRQTFVRLQTQLTSETNAIFLCSHLDWLETALELLPCDLSDAELARPWTTAEFQIFRVQDGVFEGRGRGAIPSRG